jgi:signal transduction histidine kinase
VAEVLAVVAICAVSAGCGALLSLRPGVLATGALAAALAIAGPGVMPVLLTTLAPWTAGRVVRSRRQLIAALAERNRQLEAEQNALAELAVRRERARIARELHDIVAHHVAVMVIQAGAGRLGAPDGAARFAGIGDAGREALTELRRLVEVLSTDDPRPRDLETLLGQARAAGVRLDYTPLPDSVRVAPELQDAAYRVVQEALTNAMKHAAGSNVLVRLGLHARALEVEVCDRGAATPSPLATSGAGLGLAGMRERVEALGGILEAGPVDADGWRLWARLPLDKRQARRTSAG